MGTPEKWNPQAHTFWMGANGLVLCGPGPEKPLRGAEGGQSTKEPAEADSKDTSQLAAHL